MTWLSKMHSPDPTVSNPRVWYSLVMLFIMVNLTVAMCQHGLTADWVELAKWLLGTVVAGYGVTKTAAVISPPKTEEPQ